MRKILRRLFINNFKSIFHLIQNSKSTNFKIKYLNLEIKRKCKLGEKGTFLKTRVDQIITPNIFKNGSWDYFIIDFINRNTKNNINYSFIDIGANIGLITKQIIEKNKSNINKFYCIEPEGENYYLLCQNLIQYKKKDIRKFKIAVTNKKSRKKKIYINENNFGDFSLIHKSYLEKFEIINTVNINEFFKNNLNLKKEKNIIYKSDIQGLDEIILLAINNEIIKNFKLLIIEISNPKFLSRNYKKFEKILEQFNYIECYPDGKISKALLKKKIYNEDKFDLMLSKN